jgi:hypothetical protein
VASVRTAAANTRTRNETEAAIPAFLMDTLCERFKDALYPSMEAERTHS